MVLACACAEGVMQRRGAQPNLWFGQGDSIHFCVGTNVY